MPGPVACRLIVDGPASGVRNMAVDEALLGSVAAGGPPALRFYSWSEPTLSLGYFQRHGDRSAHPPSAALPMVRRSSGGGALVHHHELTYSLALPASARRDRDTTALTCLAHQALIAAVDELASEPTRLTTCATEIQPSSADEPFLCFRRRAKGDVLVPAGAGQLHKVCGSAQRKRGGAVLQHGGVLLAASAFAPELEGLAEMLPAPVDGDAIATAWSHNLLRSLDLQPESGGLTPAEEDAAQRLAETRFAATDWTLRR